MQTEQLSWSEPAGWQAHGPTLSKADLVIYFGLREALACGSRYKELREQFPDARILGCSTGGQIHDDDITDEIAAVAIGFANTKVKLACEPAEKPETSRASGEAIGRALNAEDLAGIFVLSDGLNVNGSELVAGIRAVVGDDVPITGGLAGDGADFKQTVVGGDCEPRSQCIAAVGFYGNAIRISHGSAGGWNEFGPRRRITRSIGNVLYELDGRPALELYMRYLGDDAAGLPGSALLFPLRISDPLKPDHDLVRTILAVNREDGSMTFAGDMPQGFIAQFMRGNFDSLAAGAADAARQAAAGISETNKQDGIAILVSCIGRRLLMGEHIGDEIEAAGAELGADLPRLGFYSYGEISPHSGSGICQLHNQTMTVTAITEAAE